MQPLFLREGISSGSFLAPRPPRNGSERDGGFPSDEASSGALVALVGQSPDSPHLSPRNLLKPQRNKTWNVSQLSAQRPRLSCKSN